MNEIEKKFLVKKIPKLNDYKYNEISQGYLSSEPEIRIRKTNDSFFITKKSNGTLIREELEYSISKAVYNILSTEIKGRIIKKYRYLIPLYNDLTAELDIYNDELSGLIVVEVEFNSEEEANSFIIPDWFGAEITEDKAFKNKNIALASIEKIAELINKEAEFIKKK